MGSPGGRSGLDLWLMWGRSGSALGSIRGRSRVALVLLWGRSGFAPASLWGRLWGRSWPSARSGVAQGPILGVALGVAIGGLQGQSGLPGRSGLGVDPGSRRGQFGIALGSLWRRPGVALGLLWGRSGVARTPGPWEKLYDPVDPESDFAPPAPKKMAPKTDIYSVAEDEVRSMTLLSANKLQLSPSSCFGKRGPLYVVACAVNQSAYDDGSQWQNSKDQRFSPGQKAIFRVSLRARNHYHLCTMGFWNIIAIVSPNLPRLLAHLHMLIIRILLSILLISTNCLCVVFFSSSSYCYCFIDRFGPPRELSNTECSA